MAVGDLSDFPVRRLPKVFIRDGYAMIETGSGEARQIDPKSDADMLSQLEIRLPKETMDRLRTAIFELPDSVDPVARTPLELLTTRVFLKNFVSSGKRAQAYIRALPGDWQVRTLGGGDWEFAVSKNGKNWFLFDPGLGEAFRESIDSFAVPMNFQREVAMDLLDLTTDAIIGVGATAAFIGGAGATLPTGPGAIAGGALAAGGATFGLESLKQLIGKIGGIPDNMDITDSAVISIITSIFSAAGPSVGRGIRLAGGRVRAIAQSKVGKAIREAILEAGAGLSGIRGAGRMAPERVLEKRIADKAKIFEEIPGLDKTARAMRRLVRMAASRDIPEAAVARAMEKEAAEAGVTVNISQLVDDLLEPLTRKVGRAAGEVERAIKVVKTTTKQPGAPVVRITKTGETAKRRAGEFVRTKETVEEVSPELVERVTEETIRRQPETLGALKSRKAALSKLGTEENVAAKVQSLIDDVQTVITIGGDDAAAVPVTTGVEIKRMLQNRLKEREAFLKAATTTGKKAPTRVTEFDRVLSDFQRALRLRIASRVDDVVGTARAAVRGEAPDVGIQAIDGSGRNYSQIMKDFSRKSDQLTRWKFWLGSDLGDEKGQKIAASFLRDLLQTGSGGFRQTAAALKTGTGIDVVQQAERAMVSELFGEAGVAKIFPRISAVGEPVGTGIGRKAFNLATSPLLLGAGGGGVLGAFLGGPVGAVAGMGLGGTIASEAGQLGIARVAGPAVARGFVRTSGKVINALERSVNTKSLTAIQGLTRMLLQSGREEEPAVELPKRVPVAAPPSGRSPKP